MEYVEQLKKRNVKFEIISEGEAAKIMKEQFSYYRLLSLSPCFEKYNHSTQIDKFVSLDFSQLYYLAVIDTKLSHIIMQMCMDIECSLKARLISSVNQCNVYDTFLAMCCDNGVLNETSFVNVRDSVYHSSEESQRPVDITAIKLADFLEFTHFGTLVNLISYFNTVFATGNEIVRIPCEEFLIQAKRIRNIVAHNNSILARINIPTSYHNLSIKAFLGKQGICNKTLNTNMSKAIINDIVSLFFLYSKIIPHAEKIRHELDEFDSLYCIRFREHFTKNAVLSSIYNFLKDIVNLPDFF